MSSLIEVRWWEQAARDVPADDNWLGPREAVRLSGMRFAKRRADWRLGRWTAKRALAAYLDAPPDASVEILSAAGGAPEVFLGNRRAPVAISISHREGVAVCAVAGPGVALGCDLEIVEPRSAAFTTDYFTLEEQAFAAGRPRSLALLWSAKESALKALGVGLRLDTRCVSVDLIGAPPSDGGNRWRPLHARYDGQVFHGWWQQEGRLVRTLVAAPAPAVPGTDSEFRSPSPLYIS